MNSFYSNIEAFREALRSKADRGDCCWSCPSTDGGLVAFNVRKDLRSLDVLADGCEPMITLCPGCAVAYMNSFNESMHEQQGCEGSPTVWTVEEYLAFRPGGPTAGSKPTIHCSAHGDSPCSAICRHLRDGAGLRYYAVELPPDHPCVGQAWCADCHAVLEEEGGWTQRSRDFAELSVVCTPCFEGALRRHSRLALPEQGDQGRMDELLWCEFPMVDEDADGEADETPGQVVTRLRALLDIAARLDAAGWPMSLTLTGLAFATPLEDEDEVAEELARLGIAEPFRPFHGPTLAELCALTGELHDRVRHERRLALLNSPGYDPARAFAEDPGAVREMLSDMQRAEQEGLEEEYPVEDDYDWGALNGRLSALLWVLGHEDA